MLFFLIGIFGVLGATFLFPLLMACCYRSTSVAATPPSRVAVLIPAHNEEAVIAETLASIKQAIAKVKQDFPSLEITVCVGADHCSDATVEIVKQNECEVLELNDQAGKWNTLKQLYNRYKESDWVVFVDSGTLWPEDMLQKLVAEFFDGSLAAVFPSYKNQRAGKLEALSWRLERLLKTIENHAGGPVSSHGASVAYRGRLLEEVFKKLEGQSWYNDDVVLPLITRAQNPQLKTKYLANIASYDNGSTTDSKKEITRRKRISYGNVEWIRSLSGYVLCRNSIAFGLSLRRVFRLLWFYWVGLIALALLWSLISHVLTVCSGVLPSFFCFVTQSPIWQLLLVFAFLASCVVLKSAAFRGILEAAIASLLAPYFVFAKRRVKW